MQVTWLGWAGVEIEARGERVVVDPLHDPALALDGGEGRKFLHKFRAGHLAPAAKFRELRQEAVAVFLENCMGRLQVRGSRGGRKNCSDIPGR